MTQLASNSMWEPSAAFTQTTNSRTELVVKSAGISKNSSGKCEACRTRKSVAIDKYRNMSYNVVLEKSGATQTKEIPNMLCNTVNAMSFNEYSYESEFSSYERSFISHTPRQANTVSAQMRCVF